MVNSPLWTRDHHLPGVHGSGYANVIVRLCESFVCDYTLSSIVPIRSVKRGKLAHVFKAHGYCVVG